MKSQRKTPKAKVKAKTNINRQTQFSVPMKVRSSNIQSFGMPVSLNGSSSGQYGGQHLAKPDTIYLTMVVQRFDNSWMYVRVNTHCLDVTGEPCVFDEHRGPELLEIWKRVVLDNAIPWEDQVRTETMRIVRYKPELSDVTLSLFHDDASVQEFLRLSAMSKLSDAEARLLGATHMKAKQKIMHDPNFHRDDAKLLTELQQESARLPLNVALASLHEDN